jgi:hypothetical protein
MALTAQLDPHADRVAAPRDQRLPMTLLALLLISVLGTGISVAAFFVPGAVVSALFVVLFYALIVGVKLRNRHAWAVTHATQSSAAQIDDDAPGPNVEEIAPDLAREVVAAERAGFRMGVIIVAPLAALAVVLAAIFVGWKIIGLGALFFFAIMIFMGAPVWLAAMEEEIDDEEEKIGVEIHRIH